MIILCNDRGFVGIRNGIGFSFGQAETDDPEKIKWFKENGYEVIDGEKTVAKVTRRIESGTVETEIDNEPETETGEVEEFTVDDLEPKKRGRRKKEEPE